MACTETQASGIFATPSEQHSALHQPVSSEPVLCPRVLAHHLWSTRKPSTLEKGLSSLSEAQFAPYIQLVPYGDSAPHLYLSFQSSKAGMWQHRPSVLKSQLCFNTPFLKNSFSLDEFHVMVSSPLPSSSTTYVICVHPGPAVISNGCINNTNCENYPHVTSWDWGSQNWTFLWSHSPILYSCKQEGIKITASYSGGTISLPSDSWDGDMIQRTSKGRNKYS